MSMIALWQLLASANVPPWKAEQIVQAVRIPRIVAEPSGVQSYEHVRQALLRQPSLFDTERERIVKANLEPVAKAVFGGVRMTSRKTLPRRIRAVDDFPAALFTRGDPSVLERPTVAIAGTRAASPYGKAAAIKFAEELANRGVTILTGGALGIEAAAHSGAFAAGGPSVALPAAGVDKAYPASHNTLFQRITDNGCLMSPFPLGTVMHAHLFSFRNRVIAALADAVLMIEAPEGSGSLSTANAAAELGRQVFVVPSNITSLSFRGSHALIRMGATLVDHPDQVLLDLGLPTSPPKPTPESLTESQQKILEAIGTNLASTDQITEATGLEPSTVMAELTVLEFSGKVIRSQEGYSVCP